MPEPTLSEIKELIVELKQSGMALNNNILSLDSKLEKARTLIITLRDISENLRTLVNLIKTKTDSLPKGFTRGGQYKAR